MKDSKKTESHKNLFIGMTILFFNVTVLSQEVQPSQGVSFHQDPSSQGSWDPQGVSYLKKRELFKKIVFQNFLPNWLVFYLDIADIQIKYSSINTLQFSGYTGVPLKLNSIRFHGLYMYPKNYSSGVSEEHKLFIRIFFKCNFINVFIYLL